MAPMRAAASSVTAKLVRAGRKLLGSVNRRRSLSRFSGRPTSARRMVWTSEGVPVKWVWIWMICRSDTTSRGGLSRARA